MRIPNLGVSGEMFSVLVFYATLIISIDFSSALKHIVEKTARDGETREKGRADAFFVPVASARPFSVSSRLAESFRPEGARPNVLFGTGGESAGCFLPFLHFSRVVSDHKRMLFLTT